MPASPDDLLHGSAPSLPEDLLRDQAHRLQLFYLVGVAFWAVTFLMDSTVAPRFDKGPLRAPLETIGAASALATALFVRFGPGRLRQRRDVAVAAVVIPALLLGIAHNWHVQPTTERPLSPNVVLILFFGLLAPARPRTLLVVGVLAGLMDPLAVWLGHLRGLPAPDVVTTLALFYPNYVCAALAVAPSRLLYRLGREIREARALGSYTLLERLGEGGMGEVWLAQHRLLASQAAIKLIRPDRLGTGAVDPAVMLGRFEREAQATAALTSPHTIRLFDFGVTEDRTFYYVMERLYGRDLESLVKEFGPLPPARVMHLVRQMCRSLAEAHALGLVHRDIKPANIYLCRVGLEHDFVKVLDFGLVRHANRAAASTLTTLGHALLGTPAYMAPEAIVGDSDVDRRVDVYAIGCVAYYLLTGQRVFDGATPMQVLTQHLHETPVPPSERATQPVPPAVDAFVMACLHKHPAERPADAAALVVMADACRMVDHWDEGAAGAWWHTHLPELAAPAQQARSAVPEWSDRSAAYFPRPARHHVVVSEQTVPSGTTCAPAAPPGPESTTGSARSART